VPQRAVGLAGVPSALPETPQLVRAGGHWLEVVGVDARPVAAQVVELQPLGDGTDEFDEHAAMNERLAVPRVAGAIALGIA